MLAQGKRVERSKGRFAPETRVRGFSALLPEPAHAIPSLPRGPTSNLPFLIPPTPINTLPPPPHTPLPPFSLTPLPRSFWQPQKPHLASRPRVVLNLVSAYIKKTSASQEPPPPAPTTTPDSSPSATTAIGAGQPQHATHANDRAPPAAAAAATAAPRSTESTMAVPKGPPARRAAPIPQELLPGGCAAGAPGCAAASTQLPEAALRALGAFRRLYCGGEGGEAEREAVLRGSYSAAAVFDDNIVRVSGGGTPGI